MWLSDRTVYNSQKHTLPHPLDKSGSLRTDDKLMVKVLSNAFFVNSFNISNITK